MTKIIRTPTRAEGGITPDEKAAMANITREWINIAFRTEPADPAEVERSMKALYAAADLAEPRVVLAPSPLVMAFAFGAAAAIWQARDATLSVDAANYAATLDATIDADAATFAATDYATLDAATDAAIRVNRAALAATDATYAATDAATDAATQVATHVAMSDAYATVATVDIIADAVVQAIAGSAGLEYAKRWANAYNGGNMWAGPAAYFAALRDVLGLTGLDCWGKYQAYEDAARAGGFRVMHEKFCIVSDFPAELHVDENNLPHNETGPSHRWRDGWAIYHWHGTRVPQHWIENRADLSPEEVLACEDVEQRAAGVAIIGMANMLDKLDHRVVDQHQTDGEEDHDMGALIEVTLPGLDEPGLYLRAHCPRNGWIMEGVADRDDGGRPIRTALHAQAWRVGLEPEEFRRPQRRT